MIDFSKYEQNTRAYGGAAGRKLGISMGGENYIVKFPGNLKEKGLKNVVLSYSNSPVCEYIGSHVYDIVGVPVHKTLLGYYEDKVVVGCKDFLGEADQLIEFEKIKVTFLPRFCDSNGEETNGTGLDLKEIIMTIREHPFFKEIEGVEERFWNMFVVDSVIGNPDRNNGNWGIIKNSRNEMSLAPVYDNGNCLNDKLHELKMLQIINDKQLMNTELIKRRTCVFELNGHHIKPYEFILSKRSKGCNEAVQRIVPKLDMKKINNIIDEIPCITDVQKQFYKETMNTRYRNVLLPTYQSLTHFKFENIGLDYER